MWVENMRKIQSKREKVSRFDMKVKSGDTTSMLLKMEKKEKGPLKALQVLKTKSF